MQNHEDAWRHLGRLDRVAQPPHRMVTCCCDGCSGGLERDERDLRRCHVLVACTVTSVGGVVSPAAHVGDPTTSHAGRVGRCAAQRERARRVSGERSSTSTFMLKKLPNDDDADDQHDQERQRRGRTRGRRRLGRLGVRWCERRMVRPVCGEGGRLPSPLRRSWLRCRRRASVVRASSPQAGQRRRRCRRRRRPRRRGHQDVLDGDDAILIGGLNGLRGELLNEVQHFGFAPW